MLQLSDEPIRASVVGGYTFIHKSRPIYGRRTPNCGFYSGMWHMVRQPVGRLLLTGCRNVKEVLICR